MQRFVLTKLHSVPSSPLLHDCECFDEHAEQSCSNKSDLVMVQVECLPGYLVHDVFSIVADRGAQLCLG